MKKMEEGRSSLILKEYGISNTSSPDYPGAYGMESDSWSHKTFTKNFKIKIEKYNDMEMEFDIIGIHAAIANAFRRLLISEVPSMAIEKVFVYNNTSLIKDEILAHRLGLIPLKADPRMFEYRQTGDEEGTEQDTLEFELKVKCTSNANTTRESALPQDLYTNHLVYTKHIKWLPIGGQKDFYTAAKVGPIEDDILINKLRPGHELNLKMHAVKGIGKDHAKFTPVATASYRLLPTITLTKDLVGEMAEKLQTCFSPGVIGIDIGKRGKKKAVVLNARYDSCSRNVTRYPELTDAVTMGAKRDHFIFTIESVGALPPDVLFIEAVKVLKTRCRTFLDELNQI